MAPPKSPLETLRLAYKVALPATLRNLKALSFKKTNHLPCRAEVQALFPRLTQHFVLEEAISQGTEQAPLRVGVFFSGGPAAGGHNVLAGLFDALISLHKDSSLVGFLRGPEGFLLGNGKEITKEVMDQYRNLGGFDLLGSSRTKIESQAQLQIALRTCQDFSLDGLVVIGGDDSNTNAAVLADFFLAEGCKTRVIGIPKTIDGDLKNPFAKISFGFDTACRVYAEMIGNICKDAMSACTYTHFIKLMGRSASHVTLECALATRPNYTLIGEEVKEKKKTLQSIVADLADIVARRASLGRPYGVFLIPEGLVEFIPEISLLIEELNHLLSQGEPTSSFEIIAKLSKDSRDCFESMPEPVQKQLLLRRDPHGNVQVSLIETEKLLAELVGKELEKRRSEGRFDGSFTARTHFLGYEGRCSLPSNFDATYCYTLGQTAALLIRDNHSGYMAFVSHLEKPVSLWKVGAVPLVPLMHMTIRKGKSKPVIKKALVDCTGKAFSFFQEKRAVWSEEDCYSFPGPMQFNEEEKTWLPHSFLLENA